ncbi:MAG: phosphatidate cytidylyltransferase [Tabrizicola sp.]|uniref:phosphatidate cytidylyltransferase n=1 Tax=Tabrizicola sp. TaxID=2005166 RepID=UPI002ABCFF26|nr:phosphatidate cytidylyltransferase [Tabrizicola sp.]MDZ4086133.1 phosphatidate cytidylyltransferase [Tabrizicola sp.]
MDPAPAPSGRWADLRTRILSAIVMVAVGAVEIWLGGAAFAALVVALTGVMIWELATMTAPHRQRSPVLLAVAASAALVAALVLKTDVAALFLAGPSVALLLTPRRDRRLASAYALAIMLAGYGLIDLRQSGGGTLILWLVAVVVASDVLGYFAGRMLGGPKFWERVSPKKTWSGTIAGWIGAALVGLVMVLAAGASWLLVPLSALVAFAGQLGDIAESWVKRRAGVKDASTLIPGHGGVLDRFDALIGAVVAVLALGLLAPVHGLFGG